VKSIDDLVRAMSTDGFYRAGNLEGGRRRARRRWRATKECFVVMTLSGAMTVAKQGLIVTELIGSGIRECCGFKPAR